MYPGYQASKYEYVLISDSGIRSKFVSLFNFLYLNLIWLLLIFLVKEDTLIDMISHMKEGVAIVHQMPFTCDRDGFPATFEKVSRMPTRVFQISNFLRADCQLSSILWKNNICKT